MANILITNCGSAVLKTDWVSKGLTVRSGTSISRERSRRSCSRPSNSQHSSGPLHTRPTFGVATAVAIIQLEIEELFARLDGVLGFLDDNVIGGQNYEKRKSRLPAVIKKILMRRVFPKQKKSVVSEFLTCSL